MAEGVTECDVLVIGAGPGGGSAALHSARNGLNVMLIEDHAEIGTPVHCGECISQVAVDNLQLELPNHVISRHVNGIRVLFPDGTPKKLSEPGYVLEKHLFEQWLADEAVSAGAQLHLSHKLTALDRIEENGQFKGWLCQGNGAQFPIRAKIVIDASGVGGICSKLLDLNPRPKVIAGMQFEVANVPNDGYLDFYIWPSYATKGYLWMIPKSDGRANIGLVTEDKKGAVKSLDRFIEDTQFKGLEKQNPPWREEGTKLRGFGGTIPISGPHSVTHTDGIMLVGDAAGFTSPLFEGGSHLALKSASFAAMVAADAVATGDISAAKLADYPAMWKAEFPPYEKILKGKTALYSLSDKDMSVMGKCFPEEMSAMGVTGKAMVGIRLLFKRPSLYFKKIIPAMLAFGYSRAKHYGW
ncbi:MAG: NAD(P)/FAD-dependent oxidoreductase [Euryarchaeota archaeon]|jgi:digeranylgeranylglycerophospholipid reductase|nr:NAD(P)/FAD-dependent oxidoreductase [Euryarchaeota archaeon]